MVRRWLGPAHLLILPSLAAGTALSRKKSLRDMDLGGHCPPRPAPYLLNPFQEYERRRHQAWTTSLELIAS